MGTAWLVGTFYSPFFALLTLADVFLVCDQGSGKKSYQIWINNKDEGFSLAQEGPLPTGTQAISFADISESTCVDTLLF